MIVLVCIVGFMLLVAVLGWATELYYRRGGVLFPESTRHPAHPLFTAGIVLSIGAAVGGTLPAEMVAATVATLIGMGLLGLVRRLRAAALLGVIALPILGALSSMMLRPACDCTGHAADPSPAAVHLFTTGAFLFAFVCLIVDLMRARDRRRAGPPRARAVVKTTVP